MNEIAPAANSLIPTSMDGAIRLAEMMARAKLVPEHLQSSPGDCLLVIEAANRWGMSPLAVAQCTSVIGGKLMFEGKLVAAAVQTSGILTTRLRYEHDGAGDDRAVTVSAIITGEQTERSIRIVLKDVRTKNREGQINRQWTGGQIDQQLCYAGVRAWARRHAPEVMLGVYSPEEFDQPPAVETPAFSGTTIDATATEQPKATTPRAEPDKPRKTWAILLDEIELALSPASAPMREDVDLVIAGVDVQRALDSTKNGARKRLDAIVDAAMTRTMSPDQGDDGWSAAEP